MKLNYIVMPKDLGGTAVPGCGTIHQSEIRDTLKKLSDDLDLSCNFNNYTMGSTGKREFSGDIDLVLDNEFWPDSISEFREKLEILYGTDNVARNGDMLHLKFPIIGFAPFNGDLLPRTGFVQIDFVIGDAPWEKLYHYSDPDSAYKSAHRNLILAAISSSVNIQNVNPVEAWEGNPTPVDIIRWKWGPKGLFYVNRRSVKDQHGHWKRKPEDTVITGPIITTKEIIEALLPLSTSSNAIDSLETIMDAVKENYGLVDQERIWRRAAENFSDWKQGKFFYYPTEISRYFRSKDK